MVVLNGIGTGIKPDGSGMIGFVLELFLFD
jgi:hypothetical protein